MGCDGAQGGHGCLDAGAVGAARGEVRRRELREGGRDLSEPAKTVYQPFRCEVRRRADGQNARTLMLHEAGQYQRRSDRGASRPSRLKSLMPSSASSALTWWLTAPAVMDSFFGDPGETLMACRALKSLKGIQA